MQFLVILTDFHMICKLAMFYYFHLSTSEMLCNKEGRNEFMIR